MLARNEAAIGMAPTRTLTAAVVGFAALAARGRADPAPAAPTDVGEGSVEDVAAWLDEVGFGVLKRSFAKHVMDGQALRDITEEELRELGVKKVGQRKLFGRLLCEALPDCQRPDMSAPNGQVNVTGFSIEDVGSWLVGEGFGDAKAKFAAHEVDGPALLDLSEDELKGELGVSRLGPRRRFGRALCAVMPGCNTPRRTDEAAAWSVDDVGHWLEEIGLGKYKKSFAKHEVDGLTLPAVEEQDLKEDLGVVEIGLRKRYRLRLCAIDPALCKEENEAGESTGVGGIDVAQYIQRAQQLLQKSGTGESGELDLAAYMQAALKGARGTKDGAASSGASGGGIADTEAGQAGTRRTVVAEDGSTAVTDDLDEAARLADAMRDRGQ